MRDDLWAQGQVQDPSPCIGAWQTSRVIALAIQLALTGVYGSSFFIFLFCSLFFFTSFFASLGFEHDGAGHILETSKTGAIVF
jgi:hypothetical protein